MFFWSIVAFCLIVELIVFCQIDWEESDPEEKR